AIHQSGQSAGASVRDPCRHFRGHRGLLVRHLCARRAFAVALPQQAGGQARVQPRDGRHLHGLWPGPAAGETGLIVVGREPSPAPVPQGHFAALTRHTTLPTSSATRSPPALSTITPTGRPCASPLASRKPLT